MAMEGVLKCLIRDAQALGRGYAHIKTSSEDALELLESQSGLMKSTPHELRGKCFTALKSALMSASGHMLKLGLVGVQKLLRDNHFISKNCDPQDDQLWLLSQLIDCLSFPNWTKVTEEVQIEICKMYIVFSALDMKYLNLNAHLMVNLLNRVSDMAIMGGLRSRKHATSITQAAVQNLETFSKYSVAAVSDSCDVNQAIPIIQFLCDKLDDGLATEPFLVELALEAINALLSNLPDQVVFNSRSHNFVWRTLCPALLKLIGLPGPNVQLENKLTELRCVTKLLRIFGNVQFLRPVLESLFHRLIVIKNDAIRTELFKTIKEVFSGSQSLLVISGPFLIQPQEDESVSESNEFGIMRILFDAMEESAKSEKPELRTLVLECTNKILDSLLSLTGSPGPGHISDDFVEKINQLYSDLESSDYIGTLSYPSSLRLPKTYEQLVKDHQEIKITQLPATTSVLELLSNEIEPMNDDACSVYSGATEGPESTFMDKDMDSDVELFDTHDDHPPLRSNHVDMERQAARKFLRDLELFIAGLGNLRSPLEVDLALQQFASDYCEESRQTHVIFNADGIYLATYATLLLNFELAKRNYYPSRMGFLPQSEDDFIASVLNSGILIYQTAEFLAELYQGVLISNVLSNAGFNAHADSNAPLSTCALINLLTDVRQVQTAEQSSCFLSDCRKLHFAFTPNFLLREPRRQAGMKFSRRLLTCFWDSFLFVFSQGIVDETDNRNQSISLALEGLQCAAKLSNILGLQDRSGTIFSLLASVACGYPRVGSVLSHHKKIKNRLMKARLAILSKPVFDIELPHILSLDVVLNKGLELASYNKEAWTHILRCCLFVTELERRIYQSKKVDRYNITAIKQYTSKLQWKLKRQNGPDDDLNLTSTTFGGLEEESTDSYSFLTAASQLPSNDNDVQQLVDKATKSDSYKSTGRFDDESIARMITGLSDRVAMLFEDAAAKLNLQSLLMLIKSICDLCRVQLSHIEEENVNSNCQWVLNRIGEVMLRSIKTGRPLYHGWMIWSVVGPTLLKAACSVDLAVAKTSVEILRSIISHVLQEQPEPRHFHFNEALFKPFEYLLCRESCHQELQDQIMSSLCELTCLSSEIRSGWRPLFGCLCHWPPPPQEPTGSCSSNKLIHTENISTVKEVLASFVQQAANHPLIFANAAMDAILCQLHYLKCYRYVPELAEPALDYLLQFSKMLSKLCLDQANQPVFYSAMRLTFLTTNECDFSSFFSQAFELSYESMEAEDGGCWANLFEFQTTEVKGVRLWNASTGIYKVFYLLIDGITNCLNGHIQNPVQKTICEVVMTSLNLLIDVKEYEFTLLCLRCSILPGVSHWLNLMKSPMDGQGNFKQFCGMLAEVVTRLMLVSNEFDFGGELTFLFRQVILIYAQCACTVDNESLVRIGNSCIRHLVLHSLANQDQLYWDIAASALILIIRHNLTSAQQLIQDDQVVEQHTHQHQFRLHHLAQQVFNTTVADFTPPSINCCVFVALLSVQLATNIISNIISSSNTSLLGNDKEILAASVFVENLQPSGKVSCTTLAIFCPVLRTISEFGIDWELAINMRESLKKALGFVLLPSLKQITILSSELLVLALANVGVVSPRHMRELEQWIDFLIDFYFQESGSGFVLPSQQLSSNKGEEHNVVSCNDETVADAAQISDEDSGKNVELDQAIVVNQGEAFHNQMVAALESYRQQKKLRTRLSSTEPNSPSSTPKALRNDENISKSLLLSAMQLLSRLDVKVQQHFEILWNILTRIRLHCTDRQLRQVHEEFERVFPLGLSDTDNVDLDSPTEMIKICNSENH